MPLPSPFTPDSRKIAFGSAATAGPQAIRALVATTVAGGSQARPVVLMAPVRRNGSVPSAAAHARPSRVGSPAPEVALHDLQGRIVRLQDLRGKTTLVLFWNPGCGYCRRMLEDVKAWEANPPEGAPKLLVISTGSVEANREMDLRSPVLLDEGFAAGRAFEASGTPSAVLVDAAGTVASEMAVGAPAVLALAVRRHSQPHDRIRKPNGGTELDVCLRSASTGLAYPTRDTDLPSNPPQSVIRACRPGLTEFP